MDATWLKNDAVRSALALAAFVLTGCLAWLQGDVVPRPVDDGAPVVGIVDAGAHPAH